MARDASLLELNRNLTLINKKMDNLMDERFSGVSIFDKAELDEKYRALKIERQEIYENISNVGIYSDTVNDMTLKTFSFASKAKMLFDNSKTLDDKRKIIMAIGTNLVIKDKKVSIQAQIPFLMIQNAVSELKAIKTGCYNNMISCIY